MLNIKNLEAKVDNKHILNGLNLDIKPGEVHAIMGPNGSEKIHWQMYYLAKMAMRQKEK